MNFIENFKNIIELLFWVIWAIVAVEGLYVWKKQLKWNVEYDVARKLLHSIYRIRDGVQIVRNPWLAIHEMNYSGDKTWMTDEEIKIAEKREAYIKRFNTLSETKQKILVDVLEAEVLWWKEIKNKLKELFLVIRKLEMAIEDHFKFQRMTPYELKHDTYYKERNIEIFEIMYSMQMWIMLVDIPPEDKYAQELEEKINLIAQYLQLYLYRK